MARDGSPGAGTGRGARRWAGDRRVLLVPPLAGAVLAAATACAGGGPPVPPATQSASPTPDDDGALVLEYEFVDGMEGWLGGVTDFTEATRPEDVVVEPAASPPGLEDAGTGFVHVAATNRSDDLFQYLTRQVHGLEPDAAFEVSFEVTFASNAPTGCMGVGGAPGESVWLKVGASPEQPVPVETDGEIRLSVDKGNQAQGGRFAGVAGVIANGVPCDEALAADPPPYAMVTLRHVLEQPVSASAAGTVWLFVGTDSGFEARTSVYYDRIEVRLRPAPA